MKILKEGYSIDGFKILSQIKSNKNVSTYRVCDDDQQTYFMKVYDIDAMPPQYLHRGSIVHILNVRKGFNGHINYVHDGTFVHARKRYAYLVTKYHTGYLLSSIIHNDLKFSDAISFHIVYGIIQTLSSNILSSKLHHNDICPDNIIVNQCGQSVTISVIDADHAYNNLTETYPYCTDDLDPYYCAPEVIDGKFTSTSDVFSICLIYYHLLTGKHPWDYGVNDNDSKETIIKKIRATRLCTPPNVNALSYLKNETLTKLIRRGLNLDYNRRMTMEEFQEQMELNKYILSGVSETLSEDDETPITVEDTEQNSCYTFKARVGNGFDDVAGMESLKKELFERVIWVLRDKSKAHKYKITPPNGLLLYGPPGCGKTYFAEKFAEETGFNFRLVKGSDLASEFVHGTQSKIRELFESAKASAPAIICFDEFDSFVPSRKSRATETRSEEINEFLVQLNNCNQHGIFVIGTTNMKELIDPAILRKGRIDIQIEVPVPDFASREAMFRLHLNGRPLSEDIDTAVLARKSEHYTAADIAFTVNEAAIKAALADENISQYHLVAEMESVRDSCLSHKSQEFRIGFQIPRKNH